jgi:hypothetical protein
LALLLASRTAGVAGCWVGVARDGENRDADAVALADRPDATLITAWARSRESWLGSGLEIKGEPSIALLRVVNRGDDQEDRVVVRARVHVRCKHPNSKFVGGRDVHLDERWTLGRSGGSWMLRSLDGDPLSGPVLTAPLIPNRSFDDERLTEESLARFLPPLIAAELTHLIDAWELAVTGAQAPLEALTSAAAREVLLRPSPGQRLVIRDAVLTSWQPTKLNLSMRPPAIELTVKIEAVRYVVGDDGNPRFGRTKDRSSMVLTWVIELTEIALTPWRLATSDNPAAAILAPP